MIHPQRIISTGSMILATLIEVDFVSGKMVLITAGK